jgi:hypothetical protein
MVKCAEKEEGMSLAWRATPLRVADCTAISKMVTEIYWEN